jgi:hypothetical protein
MNVRFWRGSILILLLVLLAGSSPVYAEDLVFYLKGVEIAKGFDFGAIRFGTTFIGTLSADPDGDEIGFWKLRQHFRNREDIEVCNGSNDVIWLRLEISITHGPFTGHRLVLGMLDWAGRQKDDAQWLYFTEPCSLGGLECNCPPAEPVGCGVTPDGSSNLASIPHIELKSWLGSTASVQKAWIQNGWLCHQYPFIPRVSGELVIIP